jgi:hypothetical protein
MPFLRHPKYEDYEELFGWDYERHIQKILSLQRYLERIIDLFNHTTGPNGLIDEVLKERDEALEQLQKIKGAE